MCGTLNVMVAGGMYVCVCVGGGGGELGDIYVGSSCV